MLSKNLIISAVSNLSTAYNLVIINIVHVIMEYQYCGGDKCKAAIEMASTSCLVGAIAGQLCFGYIGDCMGRGPALQLTMAMSILGAFLSAFAVPLEGDGSSVFTFLTITRFFLGVGVGGVYPLSATIASESAKSARARGSVRLAPAGRGALLSMRSGSLCAAPRASFPIASGRPLGSARTS